jgi:DNA-directed RNA polymerase subunit RPC12/RpoP
MQVTDIPKKRSDMKIMHDFECLKCNLIFEWMIDSKQKTAKCPLCFDENCNKIFITPRSFTLKFNPKTDMCDWDQNRSRYWDEYKKQKAEGKDVRLPTEDGDAPKYDNPLK